MDSLALLSVECQKFLLFDIFLKSLVCKLLHPLGVLAESEFTRGVKN